MRMTATPTNLDTLTAKPDRFEGPAEWHTTDLGEPCMHRVKLRLQGRIDGETAGALWLGNAVHAAMERLWLADWNAIDEAAIDMLCVRSASDADGKAKKEQRPLSYAMRAGMNSDTRADQEALLRKIVGNYFTKMLPDREKMHVLGVEVPLRCTLDVEHIDGSIVPEEFATHCDLVWRDENGRLFIDDFKTEEEVPTPAYLARWPQGSFMWLWTRLGEMRFETEMGPVWIPQEQWPTVRWVHMRNFREYEKKTTVTIDGEQHTFNKGESRPLSKCILVPNWTPALEQRTRNYISERVRAGRAGFWMKSPHKQACQYCDSRAYCEPFTLFAGDTGL